MPHNVTGSNTFTNPVPAYSDGDPVAQALNDPTVQALANRDTNLTTRLAVLEALSISSRLTALESFQSTITGQNLNSRVTDLELRAPKAWGIINFNGTASPGMTKSKNFSSVAITGGAVEVTMSLSISGVYGIVAIPDIHILGPQTTLWYQSDYAVNQFLVGSTYLGSPGYAPAAFNWLAEADGHMTIIVVG